MKRENFIQSAIPTDSGMPAIAEGFEKRQHNRVPVSVGVEIIDSRTGAQIAGRATDFGVGGCYVDTTNTFGEGTPVEVLLQWQGQTLQMSALVAYVVNGKNTGMGLSFTGTSAAAGASLLDWITGLNSEPPQKRAPAASPAPKTAADLEAGPATAPGLEGTVGELVTLLVRKRVLTESEGAQLRDRISGPIAPNRSW